MKSPATTCLPLPLHRRRLLLLLLQAWEDPLRRLLRLETVYLPLLQSQSPKAGYVPSLLKNNLLRGCMDVQEAR